MVASSPQSELTKFVKDTFLSNEVDENLSEVWQWMCVPPEPPSNDAKVTCKHCCMPITVNGNPKKAISHLQSCPLAIQYFER